MVSVALYQSGEEWVAYDDWSHVARESTPKAALSRLYTLNPAARNLPVVETYKSALRLSGFR